MEGNSNNQNRAVFSLEQVQQLLNMVNPLRMENVPQQAEDVGFQQNHQQLPSTSGFNIPEDNDFNSKKDNDILKDKKKQSSRTTQEQYLLYVTEWNKHSQSKDKFWEDLAAKLNDIPGGPDRNADHWRRILNDWKMNVTKKAKIPKQKLTTAEQELVKTLTHFKKKTAKASVEVKTLSVLTQISESLQELVALKANKQESSELNEGDEEEPEIIVCSPEIS